MNENLRYCAVPNCTRAVETGKLMCFRHWSMLPRDVQDRVYATWKVLRKKPLDLATVKAYTDAAGEAVAAVKAAQAVPK